MPRFRAGITVVVVVVVVAAAVAVAVALTSVEATASTLNKARVRVRRSLNARNERVLVVSVPGADEFEVRRDVGAWAPDARVRMHDGEATLVDATAEWNDRFIATSADDASRWASVSVDEETMDVTHGVFSLGADKGVHIIAPQSTSSHLLDEVLVPPPHRPARGDNQRRLRSQPEYDEPVDVGRVAPARFYPQCYTNDRQTHAMLISLVLDVGFQTQVLLDNGLLRFPSAVTVNASTSATTTPISPDLDRLLRSPRATNAMLREVQRIVSVARVVFLAQLNVDLKVQDVILATPSSPAPFNASPFQLVWGGSACTLALRDTLVAMGSWSTTPAARNASRPTAHWHLLSSCFRAPGAVGIAYQGTICDANYGVAVSSKSDLGDTMTWLTFAHELGHGFGASHTFFNGVGRTGGIMDYGDGRVNSTVQFLGASRAQLCAGMQRAVSMSPACGAVSTEGPPSPPDDNGSDDPDSPGGGGANSKCGNGVLEPDEDCECVAPLSAASVNANANATSPTTQSAYVNATYCGRCAGCRLTSNVQCSSRDFVLRTPSTPAFAPVDRGILASPECCDDDAGVVAPPKTQCFAFVSGGNPLGTSGVCSAFGACERVCAEYFVPSCGFDETGCWQACVVNRKCTDSSLTSNAPRVPISWVGDGAVCWLVGGGANAQQPTLGVCVSPTGNGLGGMCVPTTQATATPKPSVSVVDEPVTSSQPSRAPTTLSPSGRPSSRPSVVTLAPSTSAPTAATTTVAPSGANTTAPSTAATGAPSPRPSSKPSSATPSTAAPSANATVTASPPTTPTTPTTATPPTPAALPCPTSHQLSVCPSMSKTQCRRADNICTYCPGVKRCRPGTFVGVCAMDTASFAACVNATAT